MRNKEVNYQVKKFLPTLIDEEHVSPNLVCFLHQRSFHEHLFSELSAAQWQSYPAGSDLIVFVKTEEPPRPSSLTEMIIKPIFCMLQELLWMPWTQSRAQKLHQKKKGFMIDPISRSDSNVLKACELRLHYVHRYTGLWHNRIDLQQLELTDRFPLRKSLGES